MTLTAIPSEGCSFEQWSGDIGDNQVNSSTISIVMDKDHTIFADFSGCEALTYNITVNAGIYSSGSNTINASFGNLNWSAEETGTGTRVNLSAVAARGYRFDGWQGAVNSSQKTISFIVNSSEPITARFSKTSPSPWPWVIGGVAVVLFIVLCIYELKSVKIKRRKGSQTDAVSPPQPEQPQPQGDQPAPPEPPQNM